MRIEHTLEIGAPVRVVWELTVDVDGWAAINPNVSRATLLEGDRLGPGARVLIKQRAMAPRVWAVEEFREATRFTWSTRFGWLTMTATHDLAAVEAGTRNTLGIEFTGVGAGLLGRLMRRPVRSALAAENEGFRRAAESSSPGPRD